MLLITHQISFWDFNLVPADSGLMGGSLNHEFLGISAVGEDSILVCSKYVEGVVNNEKTAEGIVKMSERIYVIITRKLCYLLSTRF